MLEDEPEQGALFEIEGSTKAHASGWCPARARMLWS
jgi:hypothetical protein